MTRVAAWPALPRLQPSSPGPVSSAHAVRMYTTGSHVGELPSGVTVSVISCAARVVKVNTVSGPAPPQSKLVVSSRAEVMSTGTVAVLFTNVIGAGMPQVSFAGGGAASVTS